jgi:hypothetical protein
MQILMPVSSTQASTSIIALLQPPQPRSISTQPSSHPHLPLPRPRRRSKDLPLGHRLPHRRTLLIQRIQRNINAPPNRHRCTWQLHEEEDGEGAEGETDVQSGGGYVVVCEGGLLVLQIPKKYKERRG